MDTDARPSLKQRTLNKYRHSSGIRTAITVQQWISILASGVVDASWLNADLAQADEVADDTSWPSWRRLWHFDKRDFSKNGEEERFWSDVNDLKSKLQNGGYLDLGEFLQVVGVTLMLSEAGLFDSDTPDTVSQLKAYIDTFISPNLSIESWEYVTQKPDLRYGGYDGLGFIGSGESDFGEVLSYLNEQAEAWHRSWLERDLTPEIIGLLESEPTKFFATLTPLDHTPESHHLDSPVLARIGRGEFVSAWLKLPRAIEREVVSELEARYEYRPSLLDSEGHWWRGVQEELLKRAADSDALPRRVQIMRLVDHINASIIDL